MSNPATDSVRGMPEPMSADGRQSSHTQCGDSILAGASALSALSRSLIDPAPKPIAPVLFSSEGIRDTLVDESVWGVHKKHVYDIARAVRGKTIAAVVMSANRRWYALQFTDGTRLDIDWITTWDRNGRTPDQDHMVLIPN